MCGRYNLPIEHGKPFAFAGLWEHWHRGEQEIDSCTIITTSANELMAELHDRMPVVLARDDYDTWLTGNPDAAAGLLRPCPSDALTAYPVSTIVNNARNEVPECVTPL